MSNRLANSSSPYLLQHADNPVDWYEWDAEALEKSRQEDKPIFLSIGYAACHWCHVMAHESFEDAETAKIMNENFINIKVDREERPDVDGIYMDAVVALTGQGGWPLSVFLTPEQVPFYGGTYFPPVPRYNMPSFKDLLLGISDAWRSDRSRLLQSSDQISAYIRRNQSIPGSTSELSREYLDKAALNLAQNYDWEYGGWGKAPKFPQPMAIEFLLRRASRGDEFALEIAEHALLAMAKGGMYDVIGGGFARYSTDDDWLVPHFEKMLYDNAQLALVYLHAHMLTGVDKYRQICEDTLNFVTRELTGPEGGFYSSLDADSEGEEGKYYVWTEGETRGLISDNSDAEMLLAALGITTEGNFEGNSILRRESTDEELARKFGLETSDVKIRIGELSSLMLAEREKRIRPGTDDKVLTAWNGMMLCAFSEAGRYLDSSAYIEMATRNGGFLLNSLLVENRLMRAWRDGSATHNAYLEDYSALILGLISLFNTDPDPKWFQAAHKLAQDLIQHFNHSADLFYDTRDDHESLLVRPRSIQDNATPSGNALAATALLQLAAYQGDGSMRDRAEKMLGEVQEVMSQYPTAFGQWLCALDLALYPIKEVAIIGDNEDEGTRSFTKALWQKYRPHVISAVSAVPPSNEDPALLHNRPLIDDSPTAYVCEGFVCQQPTTDVAIFEIQLEQ
jgi:uncharacterized protein YyaL (SSP411 family)